MANASKLEATLALSLRREALPLAQSFAESSARAGGLDGKAALSLALAAEEIFIHLCDALPADSRLEMRSLGRCHCVELRFLFHGGGFDMKSFNITAKASAPSEESLPETGLLLAARSVDSFSLSEEPGGALSLRVVKEKCYPEQTRAFLAPEPAASAALKVREAGEPELPVMAAALKSLGLDAPDFLLSPGKASDMRLAGELLALAAVRSDGLLCGAIAWRLLETGKAVECFGPYSFLKDGSMPPSLGKTLLDAFISKICKGDESIVIARGVPEGLASDYFESLSSDGKAFFRQLKEDSGSTLWVSPELEGFVRDSCGRLYLPRHIVHSEPPHGRQEPHSVIFSALDKARGRAFLRPVRYGLDAEANVKAHVQTLLSEGFRRALFELDLGVHFHCLFAKGLLAAGFKPSGLLPSAGSGDLLEMELELGG